MQIIWGKQMTVDDWLADTMNHSGDSQDGGTYKIKKPIRLIECFSGIGAFATALERLDCKFEIYRTSEWCAEAVEIIMLFIIKIIPTIVKGTKSRN